MKIMDDHHQVRIPIGWKNPVDFQNPEAVVSILQDLWKIVQTIRLRVARLLPGQHPQFELYLGHTNPRDSANGE